MHCLRLVHCAPGARTGPLRAAALNTHPSVRPYASARARAPPPPPPLTQQELLVRGAHAGVPDLALSHERGLRLGNALQTERGAGATGWGGRQDGQAGAPAPHTPPGDGGQGQALRHAGGLKVEVVGSACEPALLHKPPLQPLLFPLPPRCSTPPLPRVLGEEGIMRLSPWARSAGSRSGPARRRTSLRGRSRSGRPWQPAGAGRAAA